MVAGGGGRAFGMLLLTDDGVPPVLDVVVCAAWHVILGDLRPLRAQLLHQLPDLHVLVRGPLPLVELSRATPEQLKKKSVGARW